MLEAVAIALASILAGLLFEESLSKEQIHIEGAPSWYYQEKNPKNLYAFAHMEGGVETVEPLKTRLVFAMEKRIQEMMDTVILYEAFRNIRDPAEKELIQSFQRDGDLNLFVRRTMRITHITHEEARKAGLFREAKKSRSFGAAILSKKALLDYQKERIRHLQHKLSQERAGKGFRELDDAFGKDEDMDAMERELESMSP